MASSVWIEREYVVCTCGADGCDQEFAMSRRFYDKTRRTGQTWYCPSGHPRAWTGETTEQKLVAAQARSQHLQDQLIAAEAEAEQTRARLIRDRHRFANGVCPCCNRSFTNVARHMTTQHPNYDPGDLTVPQTAYKCSCGRSFATPHGLKIHQGRNRSEDWTDPRTSDWRRHLTVAVK